MASQDVADRIAQELADWLELRATQIADAVMQSPYRPRVVEPTRADALAYYRTVLLNPDDTPNPAGKAQFVQQYGPQAYADTAKALAKHIAGERAASGVPLQPLSTRPPTNTQLMLGQLPEPGPSAAPLLATPGGA
jgi:hypothetical protein